MNVRIGALEYEVVLVSNLCDGDVILNGILTHAGIEVQDERTVDVLAHGIVAVLCQNPPDVVEFLVPERWQF